MTTIGEQNFMHSVMSSLNRIANCLEADENRKRAKDPVAQRGCSSRGCRERAVVVVNDRSWCINHLDQGFAMLTSVRNAAAAAKLVKGDTDG